MDQPIISALAIPVFPVVGMAIRKDEVSALIMDIGGLFAAFFGKPGGVVALTGKHMPFLIPGVLPPFEGGPGTVVGLRLDPEMIGQSPSLLYGDDSAGIWNRRHLSAHDDRVYEVPGATDAGGRIGWVRVRLEGRTGIHGGRCFRFLGRHKRPQ